MTVTRASFKAEAPRSSRRTRACSRRPRPGFGGITAIVRGMKTILPRTKTSLQAMKAILARIRAIVGGNQGRPCEHQEHLWGESRLSLRASRAPLGGIKAVLARIQSTFGGNQGRPCEHRGHASRETRPCFGGSMPTLPGKHARAPAKGAHASGKHARAPAKGARASGKHARAPAKGARASGKHARAPAKGARASGEACPRSRERRPRFPGNTVLVPRTHARMRAMHRLLLAPRALFPPYHPRLPCKAGWSGSATVDPGADRVRIFLIGRFAVLTVVCTACGGTESSEGADATAAEAATGLDGGQPDTGIDASSLDTYSPVRRARPVMEWCPASTTEVPVTAVRAAAETRAWA